MERKVSEQYVDVLSTALIVLFLDLLLYSYFGMTDVYGNHAPVAADIMLVIAAVLIGRESVKKIGFPVWQVKYERGINSKQLLISIFIGSCIVVFNTLVLTCSDISNAPWLKFSNFYQPYFLSLRAALTEELVYRFLAFSVVVQFTDCLFKSRAIGIAAGALVSSFLFGLLHQGFYFSFVIGVGLCYIYKNNGLVFAMVVHFLADFIPFLMIYLRQ